MAKKRQNQANKQQEATPVAQKDSNQVEKKKSGPMSK